jgi:TolB-like protein
MRQFPFPPSLVLSIPASLRRAIAVFGTLAVTACASGPRPDAIPRLERTATSRPSDEAAARGLGIAYYKAGRYADARTQLERAARLDPRDGTAALYLGLSDEQLHDIPAAKAAYQSYVQYGRTSGVRRQLQARLAALTRLELQLAAKTAVQQEQQLSAQPASPKVVAVMPLRFVGTDTTLQPLERGMAELMTTDLARSHELTVVERAKLQAVMDEIKLQGSGQTDATSNVRAGRIIQAGSVVNGQIAQTAQRIRVDAAIVNTSTAQLTGGAQNENTLEQVFSIEKIIVLQLLDSLGVRLTTAERDSIEQRPTRSLQAFLAYSRGLRFEDQGRYDDASRSFQDASRIDPGFLQAQQKGAESAAISQGSQLTTTSIEGGLTGTSEGQAAEQSASGGTGDTGNTASNAANDVNTSTADNATSNAGASGNAPPTKDTGTSGLGSDQTGSSGSVHIVIHVPHP